MKTIIFALLFSSFSWAGTVSIDGKTYTCDGRISVTNNGVTCNGKQIDEGGKSSAPCAGSSVKSHSNGGGQVDVHASVSKEASIKGTVCGGAKIARNVVIQKGATINGPIEISEGVLVGANSTLNGAGKIGRNVSIGKNVTLNGDISIANTQLADGTTLNGNIDIDGVTLSGDLTCSGNGKIRANTPVGTVQ